MSEFDDATPDSEGAWRTTTWPNRPERREHGILRLADAAGRQLPWAEFISDVVVADAPNFR